MMSAEAAVKMRSAMTENASVRKDMIWINSRNATQQKEVRPHEFSNRRRVDAGEHIREFKKLRRLMQRKRHIKIDLCVRSSVLRLFDVDHVVKNKQSALSLVWLDWFSFKGRE